MSLTHLGILVATKNMMREEEWPNLEFFLCLKNNKFQEVHVRKHFVFG